MGARDGMKGAYFQGFRKRQQEGIELGLSRRTLTWKSSHERRRGGSSGPLGSFSSWPETASQSGSGDCGF